MKRPYALVQACPQNHNTPDAHSSLRHRLFFGQRVRAICAALISTILVVFAPSVSAQSIEGRSFPALSGSVDALMQDLISDTHLPGAAIAISYRGNLVVSRGYGQANLSTGKPMNARMATRLGTNTRALITGPAAIQALAEHGLEPASTQVFGTAGILKQYLAESIRSVVPGQELPASWYPQMTVQHLLDSPFDRQQNFQLLAKIIETLSGKHYPDYIKEDFLTPLGLENDFRLYSNTVNEASTAANDAGAYRVDERGQTVVVKRASDTYATEIGTDAYQASANAVVQMVEHLKLRFSPVELAWAGWDANNNAATSMSWDDTRHGQLEHIGLAEGGTSQTVVTVDGITVAIQANAGTDRCPATQGPCYGQLTADAMSKVSSQVIQAVRSTSIPEHWNLWADCTLPAAKQEHRIVTYHALSSSEYQCRLNQMSSAGYQLADLDVFNVNDKPLFNAQFTSDDAPYLAFHDATGEDYQSRWSRLTADGWRPMIIDSYVSDGDLRYAGIFTRGDANDLISHHGINQQVWNDEIIPLLNAGWIASSLSVVKHDGQDRYTVVLERVPGGTSFVMQGGPA